MTLKTMARQYIRHKQDLGARFKTDAMHLECFFNLLHADGDQACVSAEIVSRFLWQGSRTVAYWRRKYAVLNGFNRFLAGHGYSHLLPLPKEKPQVTRPFVPYVLDHYELARFFAALPSACEARSIPANVARLFFMLLYGTGLRVGEALGLKPQSVDTEQAILTVRATKFYKTRLVPVAPSLQRELAAYDRWKRAQNVHPEPSFYFIDKRGLPLRDHQVRTLFEDLRDQCRLGKPESGKRPRIHDLRHTFAVHRLTAGYRRGEDVQKLLPQLATYLGHSTLASTQVYLTMTPELLSLANGRFESYAFPGGER
jgi:integrase/recombinase XerD